VSDRLAYALAFPFRLGETPSTVFWCVVLLAVLWTIGRRVVSR
jgi:hypothetical protein